MPISEEVLISRIIVYDDHRAFEELIKIYQNGIKNFLLKLCDFNNRDVDDLFQETCIKIYKSMKDFRGDSSIRTWMFSIAYRTFQNATKKKSGYRRLIERVAPTFKRETYPKSDFKLDAEIIIRALRPEEKAAIQLSYLEGFSHKDIP